MTAIETCIEELKRAGLFDKGGVYDGMLGDAVKELLLTFQKQGHSGYSAKVTADIFHKLVKGEPLSPLTDAEDEWMEVTDKLYQNRRVSFVFIDKNESPRPYTIEGKAFSDDGGQTFWTNKESRVYFDLPGFPPKTEYVIVSPSAPPKAQEKE